MKQNRKLLIVLVLVTALIFGASVVFITIYPATDYGVIHLYNERTDVEMTASTTLNVQSGDYIVAWLMDDPSTSRMPTSEDFSATLYTSAGALVEGGRDRTTYLNSYKWWFDLEQCPTGTFTYYITFFAVIESDVVSRSNSFEFKITNTEAPTYTDAVITGKPSDATLDAGDVSTLTWKFTYNGPCDAFVTRNGVEVQQLAYGVSTGERVFNHLVDTTVPGTYTLVFNVVPDASVNPWISDTVIVTIAGTQTTTTTTPTTTPTTTDTSGTTTTTTSGDEPEPYDYSYLIIFGVGVVIVVFILTRRRG